MRPARTEGRPSSEHYRYLYTTLQPSGMRVEEHTGQLETKLAREFQQKFLDGEINTLSCTTTFELGVDVGDVQSVLMRNVPPSPANYIQRAGRAGRRATTAALVVTFARRRSHDLYHFREPMRLIEGHVGVPILSLRNPLIVRRHIHAAAFAAYERRHVEQGGEAHRDVASFFVATDDAPAAVDDFVQWLKSHPSDLAAAVARITPIGIAEELGVDDWKWVDDLMDDQGGENREHYGWLTRAVKEVRSELAEIDSEIQETEERIRNSRLQNRSQNAQTQAGRQTVLYRVRRTLESRRLIDYLATRVVLPKYGFPVDVVTLDVWRAGDKGASGIDLSRDLRMGITEYAPGAKLVANKSIWESTGLRILPGKALISYRYTECSNCGSFRTQIDTADEENVELCDSCGAELTPQKFIVPSFGFVGCRSKDQPGETRPVRVGHSQFHFSDYAGDRSEVEYITIGQSKVQAWFSRQGRITAINPGPAERGFRVCLSCGHTEPTVTKTKTKAQTSAQHYRPNTKRECNGWLSVRHLGHHYLTDVVELNLMEPMNRTQALSTLHALLAATPSLGIPIDDINGVLVSARPNGHKPMVIFDTVPGGAGHVKHVSKNLQRLLRAAYGVVNNCNCAESTSCYGCIRTYRNQNVHEHLERGEAAAILKRFANETG